MKEFDLLDSPLEGISLIEAAAGTGKTHTISRIFLRLLLEKQLTVDQILVVTFTEAATEELKDRIRKIISDALAAFNAGKSDDCFLSGLISRCPDAEPARQRLTLALRSFDEAAIYTIHGFCRRVLHDNAFESASFFETELITDQEPLLQEAVDDFWRKFINPSHPLFLAYLMRNLSIDRLFRLVKSYISRPFLTIIPSGIDRDSRAEESAYLSALDRVIYAWQSCRDEVAEILYNNDILNQSKYKKTIVDRCIFLLNSLREGELPDEKDFKDFYKLTSESIEAAVKKGKVFPEHSFFSLCSELWERNRRLYELFPDRRLSLIIRAFDYCKEFLPLRKERLNVQFFDDLLVKLYEALERKSGESLSKSIRNRYKAALIDEFQDTDPLQNEIFIRIYMHGPLFMIGDPKQAIYNFRGADVFAYLKAAGNAQQIFSLRKNWRSTEGLVRAVNCLFSCRANPFLIPEIGFQKAVSARSEPAGDLTLNGKQAAPMQMLFLPREDGPEKPMAKSQALYRALRGTAVEIARLLDGKTGLKIDGENAAPQDIAVLVRRNEQARAVQKELRKMEIPSVLYSSENLFLAREAKEMRHVLSAVENPSSGSAVKAALSTDFFPHTAERLFSLMNGENEWEEVFRKFNDYHDEWRSRGFIRMIRSFTEKERIRERLLSFSDGERRTTNYLHLIEVLHREGQNGRLGMTGLIKWFDRAITRAGAGVDAQGEEHQIRLETDERAVWIVTVHRSKGLEFPVVFCPFLWDVVKGIKSEAEFHETDGNLILDLGSNELQEHLLLAGREKMAGEIRLLYVALSRAKNMCAFIWGGINQAENSGLAYLLHPAGSPEAGGCFSTLGALTDRDILASLKHFEQRSEGAVEVRMLEEGEIPPTGREFTVDGQLVLPGNLKPRTFEREIYRNWRLSSFSSLAAFRRGQDIISADHDEWAEILRQETEEAPEGIFAFPRGAAAGNFFHSLLEELDFTETDPEKLGELTDSLLRRGGFDEAGQGVVLETIEKVLSAPLDGKDLLLRRIPRRHTIREMEFTFPSTEISPGGLESAFKEYLPGEIHDFRSEFPERIAKLGFSPREGYIRGFIDLVFEHEGKFYLLDWKSNFLGNRIGDYRRSELERVVIEEYYFLQYHLYVLALHRYLKRYMDGYDYRRHFGGVYYLFLRGIDPVGESGCGVFADKPPEELLVRLDDYFAGQ